MKLSAPKVIVFWIAVFLALLGGVLYLFEAYKGYSLILVTAGFILLMLGNLLKKF